MDEEAWPSWHDAAAAAGQGGTGEAPCASRPSGGGGGTAEALPPTALPAAQAFEVTETALSAIPYDQFTPDQQKGLDNLCRAMQTMQLR